MWLSNFDGKIPIPAILKPKQLWTGKQIFSMILPNVNLVRFANGHPEDEGRYPPHCHISPSDTKVIIEQGELLSGIVDKKTVGASRGSLIHVIWNAHGHEATRNFLDQCQRVINYWLLNHGYTIGIGDTIVDDVTMEKSIDNQYSKGRREGIHQEGSAKSIRLYTRPYSSRIS